jgi:hypothetical protein
MVTASEPNKRLGSVSTYTTPLALCAFRGVRGIPARSRRALAGFAR